MFDSLLLVAVLFVVLAFVVAAGTDVHATYDSVEYLERRVYDLERALSQYTSAAGVIVVRDNALCAREWWFEGEDLGCGMAWGRFHIPIGGTNTGLITGTGTAESGYNTVEYGTRPGTGGAHGDN